MERNSGKGDTILAKHLREYMVKIFLRLKTIKSVIFRTYTVFGTFRSSPLTKKLVNRGVFKIFI